MKSNPIGIIYSDSKIDQNYATVVLESISSLETTQNLFLKQNIQYINQALFTNQFINILNNIYNSQNLYPAMDLINNLINFAKNKNQDLNNCNNPYLFLHYFLNVLEEEYEKAFGTKINLNQEFPSIDNAINLLNQIYQSQNFSFISKNYFFSIIINNNCNSCNSKIFKPAFKKTIDLNIDSFIQQNQGNAFSLDDCLQQYFSFRSSACQKCKQPNAQQARFIIKSGPVLIINLMRNNYTGEKDPNFKINLNIDISQYKSVKNEGNNKYTLKSYISFSQLGFFTDCFVKRDNMEGAWYRYMNKQQASITQDHLFTFQPILLFYESCDNQNNINNINPNINQNMNYQSQNNIQNNQINIQNNQNIQQNIQNNQNCMPNLNINQNINAQNNQMNQIDEKNFDIISNFPLDLRIFLMGQIHNFEFNLFSNVNNNQSNFQMNNNDINFQNQFNQESQFQNQFNQNNQNNNFMDPNNNVNNNMMNNMNQNLNNNFNQNMNQMNQNNVQNMNQMEQNNAQNMNQINQNNAQNMNQMEQNNAQNRNQMNQNNAQNMNLLNQNEEQNINNNQMNQNLNEEKYQNMSNPFFNQNSNQINQNINQNNNNNINVNVNNENNLNQNNENNMNNSNQKEIITTELAQKINPNLANLNINENVNISNLCPPNNNNNNIDQNIGNIQNQNQNINLEENRNNITGNVIGNPQNENQNNQNMNINPNENMNKNKDLNIPIQPNLQQNNMISNNINPNVLNNNINIPNQIPSLNVPKLENKDNNLVDTHNSPQSSHNKSDQNKNKINNEIPKHKPNQANIPINKNQNNINKLPQKAPNKINPIKKEEPKPIQKAQPKPEPKKEEKDLNQNPSGRRMSMQERIKLMQGGIKLNPAPQPAAPQKKFSKEAIANKFQNNAPKKEQMPMPMGGGFKDKMKNMQEMFAKKGGGFGAPRPSAQMMGMPHGLANMMANNNDNNMGGKPVVEERVDLEKKLDNIAVQKFKKKKSRVIFNPDNE